MRVCLCVAKKYKKKISNLGQENDYRVVKLLSERGRGNCAHYLLVYHAHVKLKTAVLGNHSLFSTVTKKHANLLACVASGEM